MVDAETANRLARMYALARPQDREETLREALVTIGYSDAEVALIEAARRL